MKNMNLGRWVLEERESISSKKKGKNEGMEQVWRWQAVQGRSRK